MSELKAIRSGEIYNIIEYEDCYRTDDLYYLKSEADKVIALLKDKANYNEYAYKHKSEELADTCRFYEDELRHNKFKRCLKNREICIIQCDIEFARQYPTKASFWMKWERKWLELAEKFKEAK